MTLCLSCKWKNPIRKWCENRTTVMCSTEKLSCFLLVFSLSYVEPSCTNCPSLVIFLSTQQFHCQRLSATYSPWMYPAWTPLDAGHKNVRRGWQIENWFFTSEVRGLYPNRLAEYTNIPMLSSVVLLSATMRIGLTPLHSMSQTHGIDGQWEGNRRKEERGETERANDALTLANAHYSIT